MRRQASGRNHSHSGCAGRVACAQYQYFMDSNPVTVNGMCETNGQDQRMGGRWSGNTSADCANGSRLCVITEENGIAGLVPSMLIKMCVWPWQWSQPLWSPLAHSGGCGPSGQASSAT